MQSAMQLTDAFHEWRAFRIEAEDLERQLLSLTPSLHMRDDLPLSQLMYGRPFLQLIGLHEADAALGGLQETAAAAAAQRAAA